MSRRRIHHGEHGGRGGGTEGASMSGVQTPDRSASSAVLPASIHAPPSLCPSVPSVPSVVNPFPPPPLPHDRLEPVEAWGMTARTLAYVYRPSTPEGVQEVFETGRRHGRTVALRGAGRSYGDASLNR